MIQSGINGWAKVEYDGKIGYVSEEYLTPVNTVKDQEEIYENYEKYI